MRRRSFRSRIPIIIILLLVVVILIGQPFAKPFRDIFTSFTQPAARLIHSSTGWAGELADSFRTVQQLQRENKELSSKLAVAYGRLGSLGEVKTENDSLRRQLKLMPKTNQEIVAASVIGHDPTNLLEYILIDKGSSDGIEKGAAILSDGALIGQCTEVTDHTAKVALISDSHSQINAIVQSSRANGIVSGSLGSGVIITQIPQNESISIGDTIVSSGLGGGIPKGLFIGTVESIRSRPNDIFQTGSIKTPVNLTKLEIVYVLKKGS